MANVFQCDACKKVGKKKHVVLGKELCEGCSEKVEAVLSPKPRGPKPGEAGEGE